MQRVEQSESSPAEARAVAKSLELLDSLAPKLPSLKVVERIGLRSRFSGERCAVAGAEQSPVTLLARTVAAIVALHETHRAFPGELPGFSLKRVAWLYECANELARVLEAETHAEGARGAANAFYARELRKAKLARERLYDALAAVLADTDVTEATALTRASGNPSSDEQLASSLQELIRLSEDWVERADDAWLVRVVDAGLNEVVIDQAREAVAALRAALSPPVVRSKRMLETIVGRVALELDAAIAASARAHAANSAVPTLDARPSAPPPGLA